MASEVAEVKSFFQCLWENAKTVRELQKFKKMFNTEKRRNIGDSKKTKPHTRIRRIGQTIMLADGTLLFLMSCQKRLSERLRKKQIGQAICRLLQT